MVSLFGLGLGLVRERESVGKAREVVRKRMVERVVRVVIYIFDISLVRLFVYLVLELVYKE